MANRTKLTDRAKARFLEVLRATCNVSEAARAIGMARQGLYEARKREAEFARLWDEAVEEAVDCLEREAWRRAVEGFEEPVFYQGAQVGVVKKYSDRMLELLLKGHLPEKYKDRHEVTGGLTPIKYLSLEEQRQSQLTDKELATLKDIASKLEPAAVSD